jgi:hypothetical protein
VLKSAKVFQWGSA